MILLQRYALGKDRINRHIAKTVLRNFRFADVPKIGRRRFVGIQPPAAVILGFHTPGLAAKYGQVTGNLSENGQFQPLMVDIHDIVFLLVHQAHLNFGTVAHAYEAAFISAFVEADSALGHFDGADDAAGLPVIGVSGDTALAQIHISGTAVGRTHGEPVAGVGPVAKGDIVAVDVEAADLACHRLHAAIGLDLEVVVGGNGSVQIDALCLDGHFLGTLIDGGDDAVLFDLGGNAVIRALDPVVQADTQLVGVDGIGGDPAAEDLTVHRDAHRVGAFIAGGAGSDAVLVDLHDALGCGLVRGIHVEVPEPAPILVILGQLVAALGTGHHGGQVVDADLDVPVGDIDGIVLLTSQLIAHCRLLACIGFLLFAGQLQRPTGWVLERNRQLHHRKDDVHAVGLCQTMDAVTLGKSVIVMAQFREVCRRQGQGHGLKLGAGEPLLGFGFQVRRNSHIIPGVGGPDPAKLVNRILTEYIVLPIIDGGNIHPLFQGFNLGFSFQGRTQRNQGCHHILCGGGFGVVQQVQAELNGLGAVVAVLLDADPVQNQLVIHMAQPQITTQTVHQLLPNGFQCVFVVGVAIKAVVGVGDGDIAQLDLLARLHLAVVDFQHLSQQCCRGNIVVLRLGLDGVRQKTQRSGAVDLLVPVAVNIGDLPHLSVKNLPVVTKYGDHGFPAADAVIERVVRRDRCRKYTGVPRLQFQDGIGQHGGGVVCVIQHIAVQLDFIHQITLLRK